MGFWDLFAEQQIPRKRKALCPYCFGEIDQHHLEYACSIHPAEKIIFPEINKPYLPQCDGYGGITGTNCQTCCSEHDISGLVMPVDSIRCNANSPQGASQCSAIMPYSIVDPEYTVFKISLVGTSGCGSSCYKLRLINELRAAFRQPPVKNQYTHFPIIKDGFVPLPKSTEKIFDFAMPEFYSFIDPDGSKILLVVYDFAGEDVCNIKNENKSSIILKKTILNSDAVFFLIDPEQNFKDHLGNKDFKLGAEQTSMPDIIENILTSIQVESDNLKEYNNAKGITDIVRTPKIAYIFTKADKTYFSKALRECNSKISSSWPGGLFSDVSGNPIYSSDVKKAIPDPKELLEILVKENDMRYKIIFDYPPFCSKDDIRYFIVSALGFGNTISENHETIKLGRPYRVLDPLL